MTHQNSGIWISALQFDRRIQFFLPLSATDEIADGGFFLINPMGLQTAQN
jgi:hypothetical protein